MPIRLNLLAEAQAAEEERRRDPVKRALWAGALLAAGMLAWASYLQLRVTLEKSALANSEIEIQNIQSNYDKIVASQKALATTTRKLDALQRLSSCRFLQGNLLNALQHSTVPNVQMVKLRTAFSYTLSEPDKKKSKGSKSAKEKPPTSTERIVVNIEAKDSSSDPGEQVNGFKENLAALPYFQNVFQGSDREVRLTGLNPPQMDSTGRPFVLFTIECPYPETVR